MRIDINRARIRDIHDRVRRKFNGNSDNNMIRISQWRKSHYLTITTVSGERKKSKRAGLCESLSGIRVGKLTSE